MRPASEGTVIAFIIRGVWDSHDRLANLAKAAGRRGHVAQPGAGDALQWLVSDASADGPAAVFEW